MLFSHTKTGWPLSLILLLLLAGSRGAWGSVTILVGEPYGAFGTMLPVGHTTVYLDRVCADGPLKLRMCHTGEPAGVAVARYHQIGETDWIASPIMEYLYAVDRPEDVPAFVTKQVAWEMRLRYRQRFLRTVVPDGDERANAYGDWWENAGATFDRRLWAYRLNTTRAQDQAFVEHMNSLANHHLYKLVGTNCADFAADAVNFYYPGTVRMNRWPDLGYLTPKQVAWSMERYGQAHPEAGFQVLEIPQLPGTLRRSRPLRGSAQMLLTTKRYLFTLLVIQPEVPVVMAALYLHGGRWTPGRGAELAGPAEFAGEVPPDPPESVVSSTNAEGERPGGAGAESGRGK